MILRGGKIWTGDPNRPFCQAIRTRGTDVLQVGTDRDADSWEDPSPVVELDGAFVTPGFIDAHAHLLNYGFSLERIDLTGSRTLEDTLGRVRRHVEGTAPEPGSWVLGRGWDQNLWPASAFPAAADLDRAVSALPAAMTRIDGHAVWLNTAGLIAAGVDAGMDDPPGGKILRDERGRPTGVFIDTAMRLVSSVIPEPTVDDRRRVLQRAGSSLAAAGLTGIHDMGMTASELAAYRVAAAEDEFGLRVVGSLLADDTELDAVLDGGPDRSWSSWFRLGMIKFVGDGALGSRGAALLEPYCDDHENEGLQILSREALTAGLKAVLAAGFQAAIHAIGDRANRTVIEAVEAVRPAEEVGPGKNPVLSGARPPVRVEHAQILHPEDFDRFAALNLVASMQPAHCVSDMPWSRDRLGDSRLAGAYAWRNMLRRNVLLAGGSDFPIETPDPRYGLFSAVARRRPEIDDSARWHPDERLDRIEALSAFTSAPARVSGDGEAWGTLFPGKRADLVVWDRNLITCPEEAILEARVLRTMMDGEVSWQDPGADLPSPEDAAP